MVKESWGLFARIDGEEQLFGCVSKRKNAEKLCRRKFLKYGIPFYTYKILITDNDERSRHYETQADVQAGPTSEVEQSLEAEREGSAEDRTRATSEETKDEGGDTRRD
jgi:hypothetical protein